MAPMVNKRPIINSLLRLDLGFVEIDYEELGELYEINDVAKSYYVFSDLIFILILVSFGILIKLIIINLDKL